MTSAERITAAKKYLRRTYAENLPGLKALAETIAAGAFEAVTITGNNYEGGGATGQITFEPLEYLSAVEDVIADLDPDAPAPASLVMHATFGHRPVLT
jgi:hypothetical protein